MTVQPCPICGAAMPALPPPTAVTVAYVCPSCYAMYGGMTIDEARKARQQEQYYVDLTDLECHRSDTSQAKKQRKERARELTRFREKQIAESQRLCRMIEAAHQATKGSKMVFK